MQCYIVKELVDNILYHLPERPRRAINRMCAQIEIAGMCSTEIAVEQCATQRFKHFIYNDVVSRHRQEVTSFISGGAIDKSTDPQDPRKLRDVMVTQTLSFAKLRDAHPILIPASGDADQQSQTVFLLRCYFHFEKFVYINPNSNCAASLIMLLFHGGLHVTVT